MPKNTDLMIEVREQIRLEPGRHDQGVWCSSPGDQEGCGTTYCIAGWVARLSGMKIDYDRGDVYVEDRLIDDWARKKLGLTGDEAWNLFYCLDDEAALTLLDEYIQQGKNGR